MNQNDVSLSDLEQVFHIQNGSVEFIAAHMPGSSDKDKTLNAYVIAGIAKLIESGNPGFDDKTARELCSTLGCLDTTNHAKYLNKKGNEFAGSKEKGWTLTAPGLKRGAALVKEMTKENE
jgi:hypothetical protein